MRTHEPTLSVSPSASNDSDAKTNFVVESLTREDKLADLFKPRIRKGFLPGKGWVFGVCIAGIPHFSPEYECLAAKVESYWVAFWDSTLDEDLDFSLAIQEWHHENGIDWPVD